VADAAALGGVGVLAVALGWLVVRFDGFDAGIGHAVLVTVGASACLAVILSGPIACLAAIAALTVGGIQPPLAEVGGIEATLADIFYVGLVGWWLRSVIVRAQWPGRDVRPRVVFGQRIAVALFVYVCLTFFHLAGSAPEALSDSIVSLLRVSATLSIAFLAASAIETKRDVQIVLGAMAIAGVGAVVFAAVDAGGLLADRAGGTLGPNALGLVSGLLLVIAAFGAVTTKAPYRMVLVVAGIVGLLLAKSVASFVAVGLALAIGASLAGRPSATQRVTRTVFALALAGVAVFTLVQFFRPEVTPGSVDFRGSSASQRIMLGAAGLEIFAQDPIIGAGWHQSSSPTVIGDRDVAGEIRQRFPEARDVFYPDITPTSVHNTYVQVLADLGLVGFTLFVSLIAAIGLGGWRLLRQLNPGDDLWREAAMMSVSLLLLLVWFNDNALFGGSPPLTVGALLVGTLAATARICAPKPSRTAA
jgi:O-antigen ligase